MPTNPSPTAARIICDAIIEYADKRGLDFALRLSAEHMALNSYQNGATAGEAIEFGQGFLRSFVRHPSQQTGEQLDHDPAAILAPVVVLP